MSTDQRFASKQSRVRFAIRKKYLSEEDWTNKEIAEELGVRPEMVSRYLNRTPQAKEVKRAKSEIETEKWRELILDLMDRIDKLADLERQLWDVVEPVITEYEEVPAEADIEDYHVQQGGDSIRLDLGDSTADDVRDPPRTEVNIPVPSNWKEVPQFSRLRQVWDERRRAEEQLTGLLGLDAPDELKVEGEMTEQKIFSVEGDEYPDAEPEAAGEASETDEEGEEGNGSA